MIKNIDITEESPVNSRETIKDTIVLALEGMRIEKLYSMNKQGAMVVLFRHHQYDDYTRQ